MERRGPIFIVGAQGSGTTLLRLMLDSHEHIAIPHETGFMRAYNAHRFIPFKWSGRNWAKRLGWSHEELDAELAAFYDRLFMRYAQRHGKRRWGEKTPYHTFHVNSLARLFPDCAFVALIRHPAGSVASNISRFGHSLNRTTQQYQRYNREIARQAAARPDRFALLRYEDLVLRPEPAMRALLDWLGEPWSDGVLAHHEVQSGRGDPLTAEGRNRKDEPIDAARIAKWRQTLDAGTLETVGRRLGGLGEFYGYSMTDAAALAPLRDGDPPMITGAEVDARIDRFPALGLRAPVDVPAGEQLYDPRKYTMVAVDREPGRGPQPPPATRAPARARHLRRAAAPIVRRVARLRRGSG